LFQFGITLKGHPSFEITCSINQGILAVLQIREQERQRKRDREKNITEQLIISDFIGHDTDLACIMIDMGSLAGLWIFL
jgi:hypothetical protein